MIYYLIFFCTVDWVFFFFFFLLLLFLWKVIFMYCRLFGTVFPGDPAVRNLPAMQETWAWSLGGEIPRRRKWQPTPVFLPGKSHGLRSLAGYNPWGCKRVRHDIVTKQQQQQYLVGNSKKENIYYILISEIITYYILISEISPENNLVYRCFGVFV